MSEPIDAVIGVVRQGDAVLLLLRPPEDRAFPDAWCFPGGHVEPGEAEEEALLREIWEETGLRVAIEADLGIRESRGASGAIFRIRCFLTRAPSRDVRLSAEHVEARWAREHPPTPLSGPVTRWLWERRG